MPRYLVPVSYQAVDYIPVDADNPHAATLAALSLVRSEFGHTAEAGVCEWVQTLGTPIETTASFTTIDAGLNPVRVC